MPKRNRIMPVDEQYKKLFDLLPDLNPGVIDDAAILPNGREWIDDLDPQKTLDENIDRLEQLHPEVHWRKTADSTLKSVRPRDKIIGTYLDFDGLLQISEEEIKSHKPTAKGKHYEYGRIQIRVRKELIGQKARVLIFIPGAYQILYPPQPSKPNWSSKTEHVWFRKRETG
jgi:hypothetical protein